MKKELSKINLFLVEFCFKQNNLKFYLIYFEKFFFAFIFAMKYLYNLIRDLPIIK